MTRRIAVVIVTSMVVLVAMLTLASAASAQDDNRLVCYVLGYLDMPGFVELHAVVQDGNTIYADRTFAPTNEEFRDATAYVLVPVAAVENGTLSNGITTFPYQFLVRDWLGTEFQLPNDACITAIRDGRLNNGGDQLGAPLAAYCRNGGMEVWDISDTGQGTLGFTVTADEIAAGIASAMSSGQAVLIGSGLGNELWAGIQGQLVLTGPDMKEWGKTYTFAAPGNVCQSA